MNIIKKYRFYPYWLFFLQDKWLLEQSKNGLRLVDYGFFCYVFEQYSGEEIVYFSYHRGLAGYRKGDAKYDLLLRHPFLERKYGKKKKNSKLNNIITEKHNKIIIEISPKKNDYGYSELVHDRNKWHFLHCIRNIVGALLVFIFYVLIKNLLV